MSYAIIFIFSQTKNIYRETLMNFMVCSAEKPQNFPIYSLHSNMDSFTLCNSYTGKYENTVVEQKPKEIDSDNILHESMWHLYFDGSVNRLRAGARVWIYNLENDSFEGHAFRLNFQCTNNMAEYEALV